MRKFLLLAVVICTAFIARAQATDESDRIKTGDTMPAFTIVFNNGNKLESAAFKGKVVLVNFFATWCPPCQKELAEVQQVLWSKYENNKDFVLLVVGREHSDAELAAYNEKKGFTFPLYPDKNRAIYSAFANSLIPRCYLIGKEGKVVYTSKGYKEEDFKELMEQIEKELKK
ncbi:MAG: TlpA family protein disulfide reductase [Tannerellaceae bacterium]|nr:TlpA family protein disulfide reductase [Tannerellaceae bacterium]